MSKYVSHQYYAPIISQKPWFKTQPMHELKHRDSVGIFEFAVQRHHDLKAVRLGMANYLKWLRNHYGKAKP